eukprot:s3418_g6.t2
MAMQFFKRIGDMLDAEETGEGAQGAAGADAASAQESSLPSLQEMIADPEDEAEKEAHAAAELLSRAAAASTALAEQLPAALRRARTAEMEAQRLRQSLAEAETKIAGIQAAACGFQAQQLRLAEGLLGEIKQRDAELALLRAAASAARPADAEASEASLPVEAAAPVVLEDDGPLGLEFDRRSCGTAKVVLNVAPQRTALAAGDEVISVNGLSARNLSWEEFDNAMANRPVVLTLEKQPESRTTPSGGLANRVKSLSAWTRQAAKAAARELEAAMTDLQEPPPEFSSQDLPFPEDLSTTEAPASSTSEAALPEADDAEARNRPFYELVRSSMVEAAAHGTSEEAFERWLRQFHNERDDEWFANNRTRVYNAFRPHWDDVTDPLRKDAAKTWAT